MQNAKDTEFLQTTICHHGLVTHSAKAMRDHDALVHTIQKIRKCRSICNQGQVLAVSSRFHFLDKSHQLRSIRHKTLSTSSNHQKPNPVLVLRSVAHRAQRSRVRAERQSHQALELTLVIEHTRRQRVIGPDGPSSRRL